jgi:hypothetical protein
MAKRWLTLRELTEHFGVTERAIYKWGTSEWWQESFQARDGQKCLYDVSAISAARPEDGTNRVTAKASGDERKRLLDERLEAQTRLDQARADREEARVAQELGLLIPRITAESLLATVLGEIPNHQMDVLESLQQVLSPDQVEKVRGWLRERFTSFQNRLKAKVENTLLGLGTVPDLQGLAQGALEPGVSKADPEEDLGGNIDRPNSRRRKVPRR